MMPSRGTGGGCGEVVSVLAFFLALVFAFPCAIITGLIK